jgi:hypothetical protein
MRSPRNEDVTGIGLEFSGQNTNQGALARAIFTQERVDLARMHDEVHAFQRQGVAEAFANATSKDDRLNAHLAIQIPRAIGEGNLTTDFTDDTDLRKGCLGGRDQRECGRTRGIVTLSG